MGNYNPAPAGDTGNLADCVTTREMSALEAATAICSLTEKLPTDLGIGVWEGRVEGATSGNMFEPLHLGVFDKDTLVALFGPHGDQEGEMYAAIFVMAVMNADKIKSALANAAFGQVDSQISSDRTDCDPQLFDHFRKINVRLEKKESSGENYVRMQLVGTLQHFYCDIPPNRRGLKKCESIAKSMRLELYIEPEAQSLMEQSE